MSSDWRPLMQAAVDADRQGQFERAERLCEQILAAHPKAIPPATLYGMLAAKTGRLELGAKRLQRVLRFDEKNYVVHNWLALVFRELGDLNSAVAHGQKAVALRPMDADVLNNLGLCYVTQTQYLAASQCFARAVVTKPDNADYLYSLGVSLEMLGRENEALAALRRAVELEPAFDGLMKLGHIQLAHGEPEDAARWAKRAFDMEPGSSRAAALLGMALEESGGEAEIWFDKAEELDGETGTVAAIRANRYQALGLFEKAVDQFRRSFEIAPKNASSYHGWAASKRIVEEDRPIVKTMERVLADNGLAEGEESFLQYALGKAYDNLGDYSLAMSHYDAANAIRADQIRRNRPFSPERLTKQTDSSIRIFTKERFSKPLGSPSEKPVFILGMMRSGTTLAEQILSCHPDVGAAGEQGYWASQDPALVDRERGRVLEEHLRTSANTYVELLESIAPGFKRITDKNPANVLFIGLILSALPNARVIHMRRNPIDTCLSIWMTAVRVPPDFTCDKDNIVFAYQEYLRLMEHWREVAPADRLLELSYEDLIADREQVTRQMVEFCGLEWNEACLYPERNLRAVRTPSLWQVRQPLYSTSIDRWKRYEPWLGPFKRLLSSDELAAAGKQP